MPHAERKKEAATGWSGLGNRLGQDLAPEAHSEVQEKLLGSTHVGAVMGRGSQSLGQTGHTCLRACSLSENEGVKENKDLAMEGVEKITSRQ